MKIKGENLRKRVFVYALGVEKFTCDEAAAALRVFPYDVRCAVANLVRDGQFKCLQRRKWKVPAIYAINPDGPSPNFRRAQVKPKRTRAVKLPPLEAAWREFRATMNIQQIPDIVQIGQKGRADFAHQKDDAARSSLPV